MTKDMERLGKHLASGIATAKGVDGDFVYITVGDAKSILKLLGTLEPKTVNDMQQLRKNGLAGWCPNCKRALDQISFAIFREETNFCPSCGQAVKWHE